MLELVEHYEKISPANELSKFLPALKKADGTPSQEGLGKDFVAAWQKAAKDPKFCLAQDHERDRVYFNPAVNQAQKDGLCILGQFIYYDAIVMHGPGNAGGSFGAIRNAALKRSKTPAMGGNEKAYLNAFLDARVAAMKAEQGHQDTTRVDTAQRVFLEAGNMDLNPPLIFKVYGDSFEIK
jgi:chitosanase